MKINDLNQQSQNMLINMLDNLTYDENQERLEKIFEINEINPQINNLIDYYKFHTEVPRLFMKPSQGVLNSFHNVKRKLKYIEVKRLMGEDPEITDLDV